MRPKPEDHPDIELAAIRTKNAERSAGVDIADAHALAEYALATRKAVEEARQDGYDIGHSDGYDEGYSAGREIE